MKLCEGGDGFCTKEAEADGYCDEHHPCAQLLGDSELHEPWCPRLLSPPAPKTGGG